MMSNVVELRPVPVQMHVHPALPRAGGSMSVTDLAIARHLHHLQLLGQARTTVYARRRALARMSARLPVPLLEATAAELLAWREALTVGPAAVGHYVSHARQFYGWAIAEDLIYINPAAALPVPRRGRSLPRPIGEDPLFAALAAAPPRIRPWLVLAGWAGMRAKEIAWLRRESVIDTAARPVIMIAADATKGLDERIVPMSEFVLQELYEAGLPACGWVFRRRDGRRGPNIPATVSHLASAHLHSCGSDDTLHRLRHRFATQVYRDGHDLRMVQELLGHRRPETTALYTAWDQPEAADAVEHLPAPPSRHLRVVGQ